MHRVHLRFKNSEIIASSRELARALKKKSETVQRHAEGPSALLRVDHQSLALPSVKASDRETGFLLVERSLRPIYWNNAASFILRYPTETRATANSSWLQERIRFLFQAERFVIGIPPVSFLSGKRPYICRSFLIEYKDNCSSPAMVALVLEHRPRVPIDLLEVTRRFHLSQRESETVSHLIGGLTTKGAAQRMGISPNTVKQFVRLIMSKMGVTTRSGIVGKLIDGYFPGSYRAPSEFS